MMKLKRAIATLENDLRNPLNRKVFVDHKFNENQVYGKVVLKVSEFLGWGYVQNSFFFCLFCLSRAASEAYGGSQARESNQSYCCRPTPQPQQCQIPAASVTYTTAHGNAGSLTH